MKASLSRCVLVGSWIAVWLACSCATTPVPQPGEPVVTTAASGILPNVGPGTSSEHPGLTTALGCGSAESTFALAYRRAHPIASQRANKAIVYFFQNDDDFDSATRPTVDWGIDGQWDGATQANSYFYDYVDPGEHHLCTLWRGGMDGGRLSDAVILNAEAGQTYYFLLTDVYNRDQRLNGSRLTPLESDQAQALTSKFRYSISKPRR